MYKNIYINEKWKSQDWEKGGETDTDLNFASHELYFSYVLLDY